MPRSIWKGAISFGLVSIPIELHTAVRDHRPRFRLLHAKDKSPVRYERVCQTDGEPVAWEDLVKGYEYEKGSFVVLTKDDFRRAAVEKSRSVQILDFVDPDEVDDRYFETPYYLTPGAGGEHAYTLFREAIRQSGKIGIAKIILRDVQHLAALEAIGPALVLTMMRFEDELADIEAFEFPEARSLRAKELELARSLIDSYASSWEPSKYTDEYRDNLLRIIEAKVKGRKPKLDAGEAGPEGAQVVDLMERLRKSLGQAKTGRPARKRSATRTRSRKKSRRRAA
jgi:DNA end-binding protein Ku